MSNIFEPNKRIRIEIVQNTDPAMDFEIWDIRNGLPIKRCINRNASEQDIYKILTFQQYQDFLHDGKYTFFVRAELLINKFQYLY